MAFEERKKDILKILDEFNSLTVFEIAEKLSASPATIRRDLLILSEEGFLIRTHGGAMRRDDLEITSFIKKQTANNETKELIGKSAAGMVQPGDVIFMDCGSTVFTMCKHLKKKDKLKIITNSLPVVAELMNVPGISINLIGGELDTSRKAIHGTKAVEHIDGYHADKAFIGIDGLSIEKGLSSHSEAEASITAAYCRNATDTYVLCDSSKIGFNAYINTGPLSTINYLITDNKLQADLKNRFLKKNITVIQG